MTSGNSSFCDCVPYFVDRIRRNRVLTHIIYELYLKKHIRHRNVPLYRMCFGHKIFKLYKLMGTFCSRLYLSCVLSYALSSTIIPVIMCNFSIRCTKKTRRAIFENVLRAYDYPCFLHIVVYYIHELFGKAPNARHIAVYTGCSSKLVLIRSCTVLQKSIF